MNLSRFFYILSITSFCLQYSPAHAMESIVGGRFNALVENDPIEEIHETVIKRLQDPTLMANPTYDPRTLEWFIDSENALKQNQNEIFIKQSPEERVARHQIPPIIEQFFRQFAVKVPYATAKLSGETHKKQKLPQAIISAKDVRSTEDRFYIPGSIVLPSGKTISGYHEFSITPNNIVIHRCFKTPGLEETNRQKYAQEVIDAKNQHNSISNQINASDEAISTPYHVTSSIIDTTGRKVDLEYTVRITQAENINYPFPHIVICWKKDKQTTIYTLDTSYINANTLLSNYENDKSTATSSIN